jgi:hypothetical protein
VSNQHKYNLEEFKDIPFIAEDLDAFYKAHEAYLNDMNDRSIRVDFETKGRELFSTVKHREVETFLTPEKAEELREHIRDLFEDLIDD